MRIGPAANVARLDVAETITALWSFANALGLRTDDISERTAGAGVGIDGGRIRDGSFRSDSMPLVSTTAAESGVAGDVDARFLRRADGRIDWGDGINPRDTNLFRAAPGELATDSHFNVGGTLDLGADIEFSEQSIVLGAGANHDVATGVVTLQRLDADTNGANLITGFADGRAGRVILVVNIGTTDSPTLGHENVGSVAANRLLLPLEANRTLSTSGGAWFLYDSTVSRWRMVRTI